MFQYIHIYIYILICQVLKLPATLAIGGYCLHTLVGSRNLKLSKQRWRTMKYRHDATWCDSLGKSMCPHRFAPVFLVFLPRPGHPQLLPASRNVLHTATRCQNCERLHRCLRLCQGPAPFRSQVPLGCWAALSQWQGFIEVHVTSLNCAALANLNCSPEVACGNCLHNSDNRIIASPRSPSVPTVNPLDPSSELIANFTASMRLELSIACPVMKQLKYAEIWGMFNLTKVVECW